MSKNDEQRRQYENSRSQRLTSWGPLVPILIIATIVLAVMDSRSNGFNRRVRSGEATFSDTAFLGGIERKFDASTFKRADAQAFMGGIDLDFRGAAIEGDEARIDVTAVMGGVKIRVPRTWNVENRVTVALGGINDRTHSTSGNKRLVIEGTVVMGGLEINN